MGSCATTRGCGRVKADARHEAEARRLLLAHAPAYATAPLVPLGAGTGHAAWLAGDPDDRPVVVRLDTGDAEGRAARVRREAALLALVAGVSPLPVPVPAFVDADAGWLAYARLPGTPLLRVPSARCVPHARAVGRALGGLLARLHALPAADVRDLVDADLRSAAEWIEEARDTLDAVRGALPPAVREPVARFVAATPVADAASDGAHLVFTHEDLGIEHVLVDDATMAITGVIDWSDAALADASSDFARVLRDLGPDALAAALAAYGAGDAATIARRAWFRARCLVLEDVAFGLETGDEAYVAKGVAAAGWLF